MENNRIAVFSSTSASASQWLCHHFRQSSRYPGRERQPRYRCYIVLPLPCQPRSHLRCADRRPVPLWPLSATVPGDRATAVRGSDQPHRLRRWAYGCRERPADPGRRVRAPFWPPIDGADPRTGRESHVGSSLPAAGVQGEKKGYSRHQGCHRFPVSARPQDRSQLLVVQCVDTCQGMRDSAIVPKAADANGTGARHSVDNASGRTGCTQRTMPCCFPLSWLTGRKHSSHFNAVTRRQPVRAIISHTRYPSGIFALDARHLLFFKSFILNGFVASVLQCLPPITQSASVGLRVINWIVRLPGKRIASPKSVQILLHLFLCVMWRRHTQKLCNLLTNAHSLFLSVRLTSYVLQVRRPMARAGIRTGHPLEESRSSHIAPQKSAASSVFSVKVVAGATYVSSSLTLLTLLGEPSAAPTTTVLLASSSSAARIPSTLYVPNFSQSM